MTGKVQASDFVFFSALATAGSLSAAARELGLTPAAVSKRLSLMEQRLAIPLVRRTTRRMMLTPEGEIYLKHARRVLTEIDALEEALKGANGRLSGPIRVNATLGFGRKHIAPLVSRFVSAHPQISVQLQLSVTPPALTEDAFDVCIRFGKPPDARIIAKKLAANRRVLCASPRYLARAGVPCVPHDLLHHNCISIRQGDTAYGVWRLARADQESNRFEAVRIRSNLATNDGDVAVRWALAGHGILLRAEWDIRQYLRDGRLVTVLPGYLTPDADIYATYPESYRHSARIHALVDFLAQTIAASET